MSRQPAPRVFASRDAAERQLAAAGWQRNRDGSWRYPVSRGRLIDLPDGRCAFQMEHGVVGEGALDTIQEAAALVECVQHDRRRRRP